MSLILEALRKLERDKDTPERGFLVTAHLPWAQAHKHSRLVGIAGHPYSHTRMSEMS